MSHLEIHERIKARRIQLGMSQEELAKKLGYKGRDSISKIEVGKADLPQSKIVQIAKALDTTPSALFGFGDQEKAAPSEKELLIAEIVEHLENLTPDQMRQVIQYAQFLKSTQG